MECDLGIYTDPSTSQIPLATPNSTPSIEHAVSKELLLSLWLAHGIEH